MQVVLKLTKHIHFHFSFFFFFFAGTDKNGKAPSSFGVCIKKILGAFLCIGITKVPAALGFPLTLATLEDPHFHRTVRGRGCGCGLWFGLWVEGCLSWAVGCGLFVGCGCLWIEGCGFWVLGCRLWVVGCGLCTRCLCISVCVHLLSHVSACVLLLC